MEQFEPIERVFAEWDGKRKHDDFSGIVSVQEIVGFNTSCLALIRRLSGPDSTYSLQASPHVKRLGVDHSHLVPILYGILDALKQDIMAGYVQNLTELAHADIFADIVEMADYLLAENYKDAAAVLLGGALESHLRKLAGKHQVDLEEQTPNGPRTKRAERLNQDLAKVVYNVLEQKSVTSWLDLRNKAAHAQYQDYTIEQVKLLSQGIKDFMLRHPA